MCSVFVYYQCPIPQTILLLLESFINWYKEKVIKEKPLKLKIKGPNHIQKIAFNVK